MNMKLATTWLSVLVAVLVVLYVERDQVLEEVHGTPLHAYLSPLLRALPSLGEEQAPTLSATQHKAPSHDQQQKYANVDQADEANENTREKLSVRAANANIAQQEAERAQAQLTESEQAVKTAALTSADDSDALVDLLGEGQADECAVTVTVFANGASTGGRRVRLAREQFGSLAYFLALMSDVVDVPLAGASGPMVWLSVSGWVSE
jgi:hypothetical protein